MNDIRTTRSTADSAEQHFGSYKESYLLENLLESKT